jgi:hypothetical protein
MQREHGQWSKGQRGQDLQSQHQGWREHQLRETDFADGLRCIFTMKECGARVQRKISIMPISRSDSFLSSIILFQPMDVVRH